MALHANMNHEVRIRCGAASTDAHSLRKVFRNTDLSVRKRTNIVESHIFSKGLFQCCTWSDLSNASYTKIHKLAMYCYRLIAGQDHHMNMVLSTPHHSDKDILASLGASPPELMLVQARIMLFTRVCVKAPSFYITILLYTQNSKTSWIAQLKRDLIWISSQRAFSECQTWDIQEWVSRIRSQPRQFRLSFKKLFKSSAAATSFVSLRVGHSHAQVFDEWPCQICGTVFSSKQACAVHAYRKHGIKSNIRLYVTTTHCLCCLSEWHIRDRLIAHLRDKAPACRRYYERWITPLPKQQAEELDSEAIHHDLRERVRLGLSRSDTCDRPVYRLPGPLPISFSTSSGSVKYGRNHYCIGDI